MDRVLEPEVMDTAEEAAAYDEMDHSSVNAAFVERLVALGVHGRLLDIGTGPGGAMLIRDLYRPPSPGRVEELVARHAAGDTPSGQEMLRASLYAALTPGELRVMADECSLADARLLVDTDRHMSLQLPG